MDKTISLASRSVRDFRERTELITALMGGTPAMRAAGKTYLPQEPREQDDSYNLRLNRSILYGALRDTVDKLVAKPFSRRIMLEGKIPSGLGYLETDCDRMKTSITGFFQTVFRDSVTYGISHVLVDFPSGLSESAGTDEALRMRPHFVHVPAQSILGWRSRMREDGIEELTQLRIEECRTEPDGEYGEAEVTYIRVLTPTTWDLFKKTADDTEYTWHSGGPNTLGKIPLATMYIGKSGFMCSSPPLEDMAWLNGRHWQSFSDQCNILRFARVGILFLSGITEEEFDQGITIGPSQLIRTTNKDAKMGFVEHTGSSIGAGEKDLLRLEERMEVLGLAPLMSRSGGSSATSRVLDEARTESAIQSWIRCLEDLIVEAYRLAGQWLKMADTAVDDMKVDVFNEFGLSLNASQDIQSLIQIRAAGQLSYETFIAEIRRRGILSGDLNIAEEVIRIQQDRIPPTSLSPNPNDPDPSTKKPSTDKTTLQEHGTTTRTT